MSPRRPYKVTFFVGRELQFKVSTLSPEMAEEIAHYVLESLGHRYFECGSEEIVQSLVEEEGR